MKYNLKRILCLALMLGLLYLILLFLPMTDRTITKMTTRRLRKSTFPPHPIRVLMIPYGRSNMKTEPKNCTLQIQMHVGQPLEVCWHEPGFSVSWKSRFFSLLSILMIIPMILKLLPNSRVIGIMNGKHCIQKTKTSTVASTMISGSYYVTKGYKYRTRNTITVYQCQR